MTSHFVWGGCLFPSLVWLLARGFLLSAVVRVKARSFYGRDKA